MSNTDTHLKEVLCDKIKSTTDRRLLHMVLFVLDNWETNNHIEKMSLAELRQLL